MGVGDLFGKCDKIFINNQINILIHHCPDGACQGEWKKNNVNEHNKVKNSNELEADHLVLCKRGRGVQLGTTNSDTN